MRTTGRLALGRRMRLSDYDGQQATQQFTLTIQH
jgi:hypothetical protein